MRKTAQTTLWTALGLAAMLAGQGAAQGNDPTAGAAVTCQVSGYDVVLVSNGTAPLPEGTRVAWSVRFARMEGVYTLDAALPPGAVQILTGALGSSYLGTRTPCVAGIAPAD